MRTDLHGPGFQVCFVAMFVLLNTFTLMNYVHITQTAVTKQLERHCVLNSRYDEDNASCLLKSSC